MASVLGVQRATGHGMANLPLHSLFPALKRLPSFRTNWRLWWMAVSASAKSALPPSSVSLSLAWHEEEEGEEESVIVL